jgi:hypothetical protein
VPEQVITITGPFELTSPSVYLAYDAISAVDECRYRGRGIYRSGVLALKPEEISSLSVYFTQVTVDCRSEESSLYGLAYDCDQTTGSGLSPLPVPHTFNAFEVARSMMDRHILYVNGTSVKPVVTPVRANLADFQGHVPVDAYVAALFADPDYLDYINSTIHEDRYHPTLMVPSLFQRLDPAWKDCATTRGVKDPPLTLPTESTLPKLTLRPNIPIAASLSPAASLQTPWASPTASSLFKTLMDEIPLPGSNNYPESIVTKIIIQTVAMAQNSGVFVGGQKVEPSATPITKGLQRDGYDSHNLFIHGSIPETQKLKFQDTLTLSGDAVIMGSKTVSAGHAALTTLQHTISVWKIRRCSRRSFDTIQYARSYNTNDDGSFCRWKCRYRHDYSFKRRICFDNPWPYHQCYP